MGQPVIHFEIAGRDAERLQGYYGELFGWSIDANNAMNYGLVEAEESAGGKGIAGGIGPGPEGYEGHVTFYVEVPDVEEALQRAESLGGTRVMGPMEVTEEVTLGQFRDPEGNLIGVLQGS